jgi:hypothetical protein
MAFVALPMSLLQPPLSRSENKFDRQGQFLSGQGRCVGGQEYASAPTDASTATTPDVSSISDHVPRSQLCTRSRLSAALTPRNATSTQHQKRRCFLHRGPAT